MIEEFVKVWDKRKGEIEAQFRSKHPGDYRDIVRAVVGILYAEGAGPDPERIVEINHGEYQGTMIFIIGASGYQPSGYWFVKVYYGSCSGCDTLEGIREYSYDAPTDEQVADYMALALHVLQGLKSLDGEIV